MNLNELDQYLELINSLLIKSAVKINKWREKFMLEVLLLYLIIPGRINFLQLGRYGRFGEQRYRQQFGRRFDWLSFNASLAASHTGNRVAIAFDPSYISKSGKCTPYMGRFWSGCAKMAKRGLEISGIGLLDMDLHTCFHLEAVQTPPTKTLEQVKYTLIDWYLHVLRTRKETLQRLTNYVVADAYFSKSAFVDGALEMEFHVISRFRDDAYFRYLTSVVVDKNGFLLAVMVTIACVHDSKAAYLLARCLKELCCNIKIILADAGYRGEIAEKIKNAFGYILEVVISGDKVNGFKPIGKRWVVERTFSWFDNYRRLCRNYELTFDSAEEMVKLAAIRMLLNKI